jgi:hypothetical protein
MPAKPDTFNAFHGAVATILIKSMDSGMKPPLLVTTVAKSHGVVVMSYVEGPPRELVPTLLAERSQGRRFDPPYNFFIVDSAGATANASYDPARA